MIALLVGAFFATLGWAITGWLDLNAFIEMLKGLF